MTLWINGDWVTGQGALRVKCNPVSGEVLWQGNDADAGVSFEFVQFSFKLGSEISTFQIVNGAYKTFFLTVCCESSSLGTQM